jgi:membrane fusion protein (multidrug efflux system)
VGNEKSARAAVLTAEGAVRQAELNLSYTVIQSPLTGLSSFAKVQEGAYVNPSNNLLTTVAQLDPMWVNFSISENEHLRFRESVGKGELKAPGGDGFLVEVILADGTVFQNSGRISFADPSFSRETGTFLVRATFSNGNGTLRPGQFVRVHVRGVTRPNAILVPQRAVQQGAKSHFVWVVGKDGKAEQRAVIVGEWIGDDWVITEGLQAGEQVVVDGAIRVASGATLKVSQYKAPQEAAPAAKRDAAAPTSVEKGASSRRDKPPAAPAPAAKDKAPQGTPEKGATGPGLPASIRFAFRSAELDDAGRRAVAEIVRAVTGTEDAIEVTGYADGRGSPERNRRFAEERAKAVRDALVAGGVPPGRIDLRRPAEVVGSGTSDEARRVDIVVSARPGRT